MVSASTQFARPAYVNSYSVAGLSIFLESNQAWIGHSFNRLFSGSHLTPTTRKEEPSATIRILDSAPPTSPGGLLSFEVAEGGRCFIDGSEYHIIYDDSLVKIEGEARPTVTVWLGASPRSEAALARLFFTAAAAALRRCGLYEFHAGCVVEPAEGVGVLFIGPSGSGKSTLSAQLAAVGWRFLSDDSLLLCARGERAQVHAFRRVFSVTEHAIESGSLRGLERSLEQSMPLDRSKRRFDPVSVFPENFLESCTPSLALFPLLTPRTASQFEKLSSSESMAMLIRMCPWASYDRVSAAGYLDALSRVARNSFAYRFHLGSDLLGDGERASNLIKTLL